MSSPSSQLRASATTLLLLLCTEPLTELPKCLPLAMLTPVSLADQRHQVLDSKSRPLSGGLLVWCRGPFHACVACSCDFREELVLHLDEHVWLLSRCGRGGSDPSTRWNSLHRRVACRCARGRARSWGYRALHLGTVCLWTSRLWLIGRSISLHSCILQFAGRSIHLLTCR